jgi:hypothetical protein
MTGWHPPNIAPAAKANHTKKLFVFMPALLISTV